MSWDKTVWILFVLTHLACTQSPKPLSKQLLNQDWKFQQEKTKAWIQAEVPGLVHSDLLRQNLIPDPWIGLNENKVQWIEKENWLYQCTFDLSSQSLNRNETELVFKGLDTYAEVQLNGEIILNADNMFRTWRIDVRDLLKKKENTLLIKFKSPININSSKLKTMPYELAASNESVDEKVSPFTRKAPYHFGWDWGPRLVSMGIWREVYLESWNLARMRNIQIVQKELNDSLAKLEAIIEISSKVTRSISIQIIDNEYDINLYQGNNTLKIDFQISNPKRWWPNGWGKAHLYTIPIGLYHKSNIIDSDTVEIGLRTIKLIREKDSIGESFYFEINGYPIFAKGANYIPQSHFLPSVKAKDYIRLIQQVKNAGMNMLRVWGGGVYENDIFYELCNKYGIMIWQDFMFANSVYPGDTTFVQNVKNEIRDNVFRLRNHPSIVHWNGNNEIEVAWKNWGWQKEYGYSKLDSTHIWRDYKNLFQDSIPNWLNDWDNRSYTSTSPLSNWGSTKNFSKGTMHYWGVWHGKDQFEDYKNNVGRFMSEYGFQSFPNMETIDYFSDSFDWNLNSEVIRHHQKSYVGNGLIEDQIEKYFDYNGDFEEFIQLSQKAQKKALTMAIDAHRSRKGHCWGSLFWQLNDCWPGPSWSAIDVFGREKEVYKQLKLLYSPIALIPEIFEGRLKLSLVNDQLQDFHGKARLITNYRGMDSDTTEFPISCESNGIRKVYDKDLKHDTYSIEIQVYVDDKSVYKREEYF